MDGEHFVAHLSCLAFLLGKPASFDLTIIPGVGLVAQLVYRRPVRVCVVLAGRDRLKKFAAVVEAL